MAIVDEGNTKVCRFGTGDILVSTVKQSAEMTYENSVSFSKYEKHPVGTTHEELIGKSLEEVDCHALMIFEKRESLDVVIEALQFIREQMPEGAY